MVNMGASPHTPYYDNGIVRRGGVCGAHILCEHVLFGEIASGFACGKRKTGEHVFTEKIIISLRVIGTTRESMYPLTKWLSAPCAELKCFVALSFGYRTAYGGNVCGGQRLCEHALSGKLISGFACGAGKFCVPDIRVCSPQERVRD